MTVKRKNLVANFEARSVALIASWTLAGAALAQSAPPPPSRDSKSVSTRLQRASQDSDGPIGRSGSLSPEALDQAAKG